MGIDYVDCIDMLDEIGTSTRYSEDDVLREICTQYLKSDELAMWLERFAVEHDIRLDWDTMAAIDTTEEW